MCICGVSKCWLAHLLYQSLTAGGFRAEKIGIRICFCPYKLCMEHSFIHNNLLLLDRRRKAEDHDLEAGGSWERICGAWQLRLLKARISSTARKTRQGRCQEWGAKLGTPARISQVIDLRLHIWQFNTSSGGQDQLSHMLWCAGNSDISFGLRLGSGLPQSQIWPLVEV